MKTEISLVGEPSTGYGWESDRVPDDVRYERRHLPKDGKVRYGGQVFETFVFENLPPGTTLTFRYVRPWEKGSDPLKTVQLLVEE